MKKLRLIVILGPTSSGKSDLAVALALKFDGEVISADSRQVYKGLDIGTGKITKKEMKGVPHHLLDVANARKVFTASDFKILAERKIDEIIKRGKLPIVCGGTGFYIDALLGEKQIPEVPPNEKLRKELETKTAEELFEILQKLDKDRSVAIDRYNPRRLVRAIEICHALGSVPKLGAKSLELGEMKYDVLKIGIKVDDEELKRRINKRLEKRIKQGMIAEAKKLHKNGLSYKRMTSLGLEYAALADFLQNKITKQEMITCLQNEIWHYAKRQMTWFKKPARLSHPGGDKSIKWFEPKINILEKEVKKFLN